METQPRLSQVLEMGLALEFGETFTDTRGGVELTYITGEQVISHLNNILGVWGWEFTIKEHGYNQVADEIWVLGQMKVWCEGPSGPCVTREQFGSQKIRHSRNQPEAILDLGFDLKGAATDALKKCATLVGVGLYLSHKEPKEAAPAPTRQAAPPNGQAAPERLSRPDPVSPLEGLRCEQCGEELKPITFKDGTTWSPQLLADYGRRKHGRVLCMQHYREANAAKAQASFPSESPAVLSIPQYEPESDD